MSCYLIAYDITDNRRRARVARTLTGHGSRVQKSVFEVTLRDRRALDRLLAQLLTMIDPRTDQVRAYPLDAAALKARQIVGWRHEEPRFWLIN